MKSTKLSIGFVLDTTLDVEDGVQQYILVLGKYLKEQGHNVHYIVGETKRTDIENLHSITKNVTVKFNGNRVVMPLPASKKKIKKLFNDIKFDVLHVQVPYSPFFARKVVKYADKNTVVIGTFHILPFGSIAYVGTWLLGLILRPNLKRFDKQISVSSANQKFSKKTFGTNSIVIPNMVNTSEFKPSSKFKRTNKTTELLFLGRLTERKGCKYLILALSEMLKANDSIEFHLNIAGKGEMLDSLKELVRNQNLDNYVTFLGFVSNEKRVELMQNSDVAIFPSYGGECFGIVLIESMAAKSGVVIGGYNEGYASVLGDVPNSLFDVKDTKAFSKILEKQILNRDLRHQTFNLQQKLISQYDYQVVGRRILDVYKNCISKRNKT